MLQRFMTRWLLLLLFSSFVFTNETSDVLVMLFLNVLDMHFDDLDVHIIVGFSQNRGRRFTERTVFRDNRRALWRMA